uniref:Outer membrane family protein n=1 Tax=Rhizophora mucronata TaxID=61149 RepID=A0A2P2JB34_RHIMU
MPFNDIAKLILKLDNQLGNIPFHNLTNNLLGIQISKVHNLGTSIPFIMIPFLHSVSNFLQQPCTNLSLIPQHQHNLPMDCPGQQARPCFVYPPLVVLLLAYIILQLLLIRHVRVHFHWFCLGQ